MRMQIRTRWSITPTIIEAKKVRLTLTVPQATVAVASRSYSNFISPLLMILWFLHLSLSPNPAPVSFIRYYILFRRILFPTFFPLVSLVRHFPLHYICNILFLFELMVRSCYFFPFEFRLGLVLQSLSSQDLKSHDVCPLL
jgi:hypothetical protein